MLNIADRHSHQPNVPQGIRLTCVNQGMQETCVNPSLCPYALCRTSPGLVSLVSSILLSSSEGQVLVELPPRSVCRYICCALLPNCDVEGREFA